MPLPKPNKNEKYKHFVKRFLKNKEAKRKFPDIKQRFAVMASSWKKIKKHSLKINQTWDRRLPEIGGYDPELDIG